MNTYLFFVGASPDLLQATLDLQTGFAMFNNCMQLLDRDDPTLIPRSIKLMKVLGLAPYFQLLSKHFAEGMCYVLLRAHFALADMMFQTIS